MEIDFMVESDSYGSLVFKIGISLRDADWVQFDHLCRN